MVRREPRSSPSAASAGRRKPAADARSRPLGNARPKPFRRKPSRRAAAPRQPNDNSADRLQKVLAAHGIGSRRHCEEMILAGRVEVDGQTVTELGTKVDPDAQEIRVDGETLRKQRKVYYLVHKPPGVLSTNYDQSGRPRVIDLLPESRERLFTVGRLDMSSEGLILVTNDGELANHLTHPRYGVEKTYQVLVAGGLTPEQAQVLTKGVHLAEGRAQADRVKIRTQREHSTLLEIVLSEGRNREIRRLLARVGHKVLKLKRIAIGGVRLADLPAGDYRRLRPDELRLLQESSRLSKRASAKAAKSTGAAASNNRAEEAGDAATDVRPSAPRRSKPRAAAKPHSPLKPQGALKPRGAPKQHGAPKPQGPAKQHGAKKQGVAKPPGVAKSSSAGKARTALKALGAAKRQGAAKPHGAAKQHGSKPRGGVKSRGQARRPS